MHGTFNGIRLKQITSIKTEAGPDGSILETVRVIGTMTTLEIRGKNYKIKSFDPLNGFDWHRLTLNWERAVEHPAELGPLIELTDG